MSTLSRRCCVCSFHIAVILFAIGQCAAKDYTRDVSDIYIYDEGKPTAHVGGSLETINDVGDIETVVDLRGFVPVGACSNSKQKVNYTDVERIYRFPIRHALSFLYYDLKCTSLINGASLRDSPAKIKNVCDKLERVQIVKEADATGDLLEWTKVAYALAKSGRQLFAAAGGKEDEFETADPILVLQTSDSVIIFIGAEYTGWNVKNGHVLMACEYSRKLQELKHTYLLNHTFFFNPDQARFYKATSVVVKEVVRGVFQ
jgi:hypothetical protein